MADLAWTSALLTGVLLFSSWKMTASSADERRLMLVMLAAFGLRSGVGVVLVFTDWIPQHYHYDSASYHLQALRILSEGGTFTGSGPVENMSWILSRIHGVVGPAPIMSYLLAAVAGMVTVRNIYRIAEALHGVRSALILAATWAVLPSVVFVSAQPLRDPILHLLITTVFLWFIRIEHGARFSWGYSAGCVLLIHAIYLLRPHQATFLLLGLIVIGAWMWVRGWTASSLPPLQLRALSLSGALLLAIHPAGIPTLSAYGGSLVPEVMTASRLNFIYPAGKPEAVLEAEAGAERARRRAEQAEEARLLMAHLSWEMQDLKELGGVLDAIAPESKLPVAGEDDGSDGKIEEIRRAVGRLDGLLQGMIRQLRVSRARESFPELETMLIELTRAQVLLARMDPAVHSDLNEAEEFARAQQTFGHIRESLEQAGKLYDETSLRLADRGRYALEIREAERRIAMAREDFAGTALYLADREDSGLFAAMTMLPARMAVFLLSPFPAQNHTSFLKVALLETWILYVFLILGGMWCYRYRQSPLSFAALLLVGYVLVSVAIYGALEGNLGTAYRHRLQLQWILLIPGAAWVGDRITLRLVRL